LPNLKFAAADVLTWLAQQADLSDFLLFHMRTATLLPKPFIVELYPDCQPTQRRCDLRV
jgi:hypothetical protein